MKINKRITRGETYDEVSYIVEPDGAMSVREILERSRANMLPNLHEYKDYDGENPDIETDVSARLGEYDMADFSEAKEKSKNNKD